MSTPSSVTVPDVGANRPLSTFISVDFPAPFGPKRPNKPGPMSRETSVSAVTGPGKICVRFSM